ncbi:MAG: DUF6036 family nucleotidyltransferase [Pseudobdellovibrionaceae bacterium]
MGTITKEQIKELFRRVDQRLERKLDIYVIGGISAILGYNVAKETNDVDIEGAIDPEFNRIFEEEAQSLGLDLYLSSKGIFSPPENYRSRCQFEDFPKKKLRVWYLNQYDLAISKIDRGIGKDFEDIQRVHKKSPFDYDRLVQIFDDEYIRVSALGNPREKMMNLIDLVENLFGSEFVEDAKKRIGF